MLTNSPESQVFFTELQKKNVASRSEVRVVRHILAKFSVFSWLVYVSNAYFPGVVFNFPDTLRIPEETCEEMIGIIAVVFAGVEPLMKFKRTRRVTNTLALSRGGSMYLITTPWKFYLKYYSRIVRSTSSRWWNAGVISR